MDYEEFLKFCETKDVAQAIRIAKKAKAKKVKKVAESSFGNDSSGHVGAQGEEFKGLELLVRLLLARECLFADVDFFTILWFVHREWLRISTPKSTALLRASMALLSSRKYSPLLM